MVEFEFTIRPLEQRDTDRVRNIFVAGHAALFRPGDSPEVQRLVTERIEKSLQEDMRDPFAYYRSGSRRMFWVAETDGGVIATGAMEPWQDDDGVGRLRRVSVAGEYRRRGVAWRMMDCIEKWAIESGYRAIRLDTADRFEEAVAMYRARGYGLVERTPRLRADSLTFEKLMAPGQEYA
ncbi:MAG: GNAT family N-acetyltransferase [Dehalococcoidia bacterium]